MAETTKKWVDPRAAPRAAKLREMDSAKHWQQKIRDRLAARGEAIKAHDDWMHDHPDADEEAREAQRAALGEEMESAAVDIAYSDRQLAGQQARIDAATKRVDEANWDYSVAEHKKLHPRGCELMAEALRTPPTEWKRILPELQLIAILIERNRADVAYLNRPSQLPENLMGLPGYYESVPQLMRFFSLMSGKLMNGLAKRQVVKEPAS
jgi:hypothetical protein